MLWMGLTILFCRLAHFGFRDLGGFHTSSSVHGFLKSLLFRGFLKDDKFFGETAILVWFYAFD